MREAEEEKIKLAERKKQAEIDALAKPEVEELSKQVEVAVPTAEEDSKRKEQEQDGGSNAEEDDDDEEGEVADDLDDDESDY